ncbi:MAG TPA: rhodanese-like domain-containing protein [Chthoniobacterales bacterium]
MRRGGPIREGLVLLCLAFLPALGETIYWRNQMSWSHPPVQDEITVAQARSLGGSILWVDARPAEEFAAGHIPGALLLNAEQWDSLLPVMLNAWIPGQKIIVYCGKQSCGASREVARRLRDEANLANVFVLEGGWEAWEESKK